MNEVVIINFKSPPFIGIGGRRWGKLTRDFLENGIRVHLIRSDWGSADQRVNPKWFDHPLLSHYVIKTQEHNKEASLLSRIVQKLRFWKSRWLGEFSFFDEGRYSTEDLKGILNNITREAHIDCVFVTGPPFSWIIATSEWRSTHHSIPLWVDIRDPWLLANNWGMANLSFIQRWREKERYQKMMEQADFVSSPTYSLLNEMPSLSSKAKKVHLKHFFDWDDWEHCVGVEVSNHTWVYAGQFYVGFEDHIEQWKSIIHSQGKKVKWKIFSKDHERFKKFFDGMEQVEIHGDIGHKVMIELASAAGLVLCLSDYNKDYFTTKYFDYEPANKPILYIGPLGEVAHSLSHSDRNGINEWVWQDNLLSDSAVIHWKPVKDTETSLNEVSERFREVQMLLKNRL